MIVANRFEEAPYESARDHMARHLADWIRGTWLQQTAQGNVRWEDGYYEALPAIDFAREESFPRLHGIDYILHWWGNREEDTEGTAGALTVLWKVEPENGGDKMLLYKTYIYFTDYDMELGTYDNEADRRENFENRIMGIFKDWEALYHEEVVK